ncbi:conserved hypothetical protein [Desulfamplus magnetovallimortis]|uniref:Probable ATP-binding protein BrxC winged helix-turn-helix domain-containing protein n=1 Tax=Desulfamplus magnetovallimortis TaxID=1246637 RepID=A0A1W1H537_9BACT|nr:BREX system P-loop protein BrxC [Desulfamplus magnetovallimortis]SLM27564.1 conserved hypothetical protein [Desulfamplus magnetovallimortis]
MNINSLFDPNKDIHRTIEKVITYSASQSHRLKSEISEYVVTDSIEEQFEKLLEKMQVGMDVGGENEVGVWVSGFYGSGKSSFTKYLGLSFDNAVELDGTPFMKHLQDRLNRPASRALLSTITKRFPASVLLLDLASEQLVGATMEEVSTVLYYKVLQWAGYSRNLKVATLERKIKKEGRYQEFLDIVRKEYDVEWGDYQNDELVVDSIIPEIAHRMYPNIFKDETSFSTETSTIIRFENERVQEMIDIIRETSDKQYIIFIVDEVGQYVGSRKNLILNLDGLAKNLKQIGDGKVWFIGTAQQTLTEDNAHAALNSPDLYKLKDRFPIQIDLESSDIKEICYKRLLGKSSTGEAELGAIFDKHGQALRHNTKLEDAKYYGVDFDKKTFINLYPFLPAHFDILLHLLGALAKSTGGIGLRSAIKVIQDILLEGSQGRRSVVDQEVGWLATTVTLYETLEKDIQRAFSHIHQAVEKVLIRFPDSELHKDIAKAVAVLQILGNLPVTVQNVASLMHPSVDADSKKDQVEKAVQELINDPLVPFGEQDNNLCFFSEKLNDIEQERSQIPLRTADTRRIFNEALKSAFSPLPSTRLNESLSVRTGLKVQSGSMISTITGDKDTIQTIVEFVEPSDYDTVRTRFIDDSRHRSSQYIIYLLGRTHSDIDNKVKEIFKCQEIARRHRNDPDQSVKEYCTSQVDRSNKLISELQHLIKRSLSQGSFIFKGQSTAVESLNPDVLEAAKKHLAKVAAQIFDRNKEASVRAETALAEKFLKIGNLSAITDKIDPLGLVQMNGGTPSIKFDHKALLSIRDYIDKNGTVDGKRLMEHFTEAPFGWSQDTLRYLIASLLVAGEIKLKVSGHEVTVNGQKAIDALKTNNAFKPIGVSLRDERPSMEILARAAQRLTILLGDNIIPLEDVISKATTKSFPEIQHKFGSLAEKMATYALPGRDQILQMNQEITDVLLTDGSDAPQRLGGEDSLLYENLRRADEIKKALESGLEKTLKELLEHRKDIEKLPNSGVPGALKKELESELTKLGDHLNKDDFYKHAADLNTILTSLQSQAKKAAQEMMEAQKQIIKNAEKALLQIPQWVEFTQEEQNNVLSGLDDLIKEVEPDLKGLYQLIHQDFDINSHINELKEKIVKDGRERKKRRLEKGKKKKEGEERTKLSRTISIPSTLSEPSQVDDLIQSFQDLKEEAACYQDIEISISTI